MAEFPVLRMRRLRRTGGLRRLFGSSLPLPNKLIWPVFARPGQKARQAIVGLPGQWRFSPDTLVEELRRLVDLGLGGILVFGVPQEGVRKDNAGTAATDPNGIVPRTVRAVAREFADLPIFTDLCLCAYTDHGHCGPLRLVGGAGTVDNDAALEQLGRTALVHAEAGACGVAPSAMMDGQVKSIRAALDGGGFTDTLIMSYSTKFASSLYGPFREAGQSAPGQGDRRNYQQPCGDFGQALRESLLDEAEGADILMVKPGLFYLDVAAGLRQATRLPLAIYNVSGEYAMIMALARQGGINAAAAAAESLTALERCGADVIISYWASRYDEIVKGEVLL